MELDIQMAPPGGPFCVGSPCHHELVRPSALVKAQRPEESLRRRQDVGSGHVRPGVGADLMW